MKILNSYIRYDIKVWELIIYLLIIGAYFYIGGSYMERKKQAKINSKLQEEYNQLRSNYDILETEYKWQLESCYQQLGDLQDRYELEVSK